MSACSMQKLEEWVVWESWGGGDQGEGGATHSL